MLSVLGSEMSLTNRQLRLQSRPKGLLAPGDLQLLEAPVPELKDGQALARVKYLSIDPTMRVWMERYFTRASAWPSFSSGTGASRSCRSPGASRPFGRDCRRS